MKFKKLSFTFLILFLLNCISIAEAGIKNNIVIKIGNKIVTNYEVENKILTNLTLANLKINQSNIDKYKKKAHDSLINLKLKEIELSNKNIKIEKNEINSYLKSIYSDNLEKFQNIFKINNLDFEYYLDELETEIKWRKFIYRTYQKRINVSNISIEKDLEEYIKNKKKIEEFKISEIEILNNENSSKNIIEIKQEIKENGFEAAAIKFSISSSANNKGDLGWIKGTSLSKKIYEIVSSLKVNEISNPIYRPKSIVFLKLVNKKTADQMIDVEKIKANFIKVKENEIFSLYSSSHLSKLKNQTLIQYPNE